MMQSFLVGSLPNASSFTTGGNLWQSTKHGANKNKYYESGNLLRSKHRMNKNNCYTSSYAPKASQNKGNPQEEYKLLRFHEPSLNCQFKCIKRGSTYQEYNQKYVLKAASTQPFEPEPHPFDSKNTLDSGKNIFVALYKFISPYAIFVRMLSTISASLLAVETLSDISPLFFIGVFQVMVAHLFMGIYVGGVNQLFDIGIDKVNKPYLPLASGKLSFTTGVIIVTCCLLLSFSLGWMFGSWPLIWSLLLSCAVWTSYSANVPLLRWKGHPVSAALSIVATYAVIFPIPDFLHMQTFVFKRPPVFPRSLTFVTVFMSLYSMGIALLKDIPDVEGDKKFGIYSFPARFGKKRVFWISVSLFELAFGIALMVGATSSYMWSKVVMVLGNIVLASVVWHRAKNVNLGNKASMASFYMLIWKILFAAYMLMPLAR
ncbi:glycinol 4-dimethylallyltransferase-like isoform X2 [Lotus japonicus]|uniref:Genistein 8-dimethylallytransferase n=1 Tax=Lotus japonicus TaxID=34305 RepID=A0A218L3K1_LOTJA|nr:glycinol 4-dimethylallyltransferase-like isoform X2 [Lotus japonicus]ARV85585.1 genistein 8-dimethylallytransferase [Lotus japonicus]